MTAQTDQAECAQNPLAASSLRPTATCILAAPKLSSIRWGCGSSELENRRALQRRTSCLLQFFNPSRHFRPRARRWAGCWPATRPWKSASCIAFKLLSTTRRCPESYVSPAQRDLPDRRGRTAWPTGLRIDAARFAILDRRCDDRPVVATSVRTGEQAFLRLRAMGRIERSGVLESISIRPSSRKRVRPSQRESAWRIASASLLF